MSWTSCFYTCRTTCATVVTGVHSLFHWRHSVPSITPLKQRRALQLMMETKHLLIAPLPETRHHLYKLLTQTGKKFYCATSMVSLFRYESVLKVYVFEFYICFNFLILGKPMWKIFKTARFLQFDLMFFFFQNRYINFVAKKVPIVFKVTYFRGYYAISANESKIANVESYPNWQISKNNIYQQNVQNCKTYINKSTCEIIMSPTE